MRRLSCLLLLGLILFACGGDEPAKQAATIDLEKGPVQLPDGKGGDRVVRVTEPSTVYVWQNGTICFTQYWPHQRSGAVIVPVTALDDGTGPLVIGVWAGPAHKDPSGALKYEQKGEANCSACLDAFYRCCPNAPRSE
jgi:hypothetical protein